MTQEQGRTEAADSTDLPRISVSVHLGSNSVHDVLLPLDTLLSTLYLLDVLLTLILTQLPIPLPEGFAVRPHLPHT